MIPRATISETVFDASSTDSKTHIRVFTASGLRMMRAVTLVTIPKVPSEPTKTPVRS